jgi:hypothetical protein
VAVLLNIIDKTIFTEIFEIWELCNPGDFWIKMV